MKSKPRLLLATPRTGSSTIYEILYLYFKKRFRTRDLDEYFNIHTVFSKGPDGKIKYVRYNPERSVNYPEDILMKLMRARAKFLKQGQDNYFLKVFPHQVPAESADWLFKNHEIFALERDNKFEQLLSFLISAKTGYFYTSPLTRLGPKSVKVSKTSFDLFEYDIIQYMRLKAQYKPKTTIVYEEFFKPRRPRTLEPWGIDFRWKASEASPPFKRETPKTEVLANLKEIKVWYRDSFLQSLHPI